MADLIASLISSGEVLARDIPVELTAEGNDPDGTRWQGRCSLPSTATVALGHRFTLSCADGRTGEVEITRLTYGRHSDDIRVFFRGRSRLG